MSGTGTAREALIVEALEEVALLLHQVESLTATMDTNRLALADADAALGERLKVFEAGMASVTQHVKVRAVEHIARHTGEATRLAIEAQTSAMNAAARQAFSAQVDSNLARLTAALQQVLQRVDRAWDLWLTHAATAAVSAAITWWVVSSLAQR